MKILICTGIYPPDIGGPAIYSRKLELEFQKAGHDVRVLSYRLEKKIPSGFRHFLYFFKALFFLKGTDFVVVLDTLSVGLPAVFACRLLNKKVIVRTGGDFLWESYVNRTKEKILLSNFYKENRNLNFKETLIFKITKKVLSFSDAVVFSTEWQKNIFLDSYDLERQKIFIIDNFFSEAKFNSGYKKKSFLWVGREIPLKNLDILRESFRGINSADLIIKTGLSHDEVLEEIKNSYAVILPTLSEVSPNLISEAIMYNKPFILTKDTGFFDKFKEIGNFVDPLSVEDIREKINLLLDDEYYNKNKSDIEKFNFSHTYERIAQEFINIYNLIK